MHTDRYGSNKNYGLFYGPNGAGTADAKPRKQQKAGDKSQYGKKLDDVELLSRHDLIA